MDETEIDWRLFSNEFVLDGLAKLAVPKDKFIVPTPSENKFIASCLTEWTPEEIGSRVLLVNGEGDISRFYQGILARIREEFCFDVILLWSENGAVRRFADDVGISVLHMELGPTRAPFQETVYVDFQGTNGSASFLEFDLSSYPSEKVTPAASWTALSAAVEENKPSIIELQALMPSLPFGLKENYVVVALQLADDLNTVCHSRFRTPKEFLEFVVPSLLRLGFKVVIKGHPGAAARPINLAEELAALAYAAELGDDVTILDRHLSSKDFIPVLSGAAAVCSINSSVSFEALLLGVPGLVFGTAAYDLGLVLKQASDDFLRSGKWSLSTFEVDRLVTVLCRHFLHPKSPQILTKILQQIILEITPDITAKRYASMLSSIASHGYGIIDDEMKKTKLQMKLADFTKSLSQVDASYMGHIDDVTANRSPGGVSVAVKGWAARRRKGAEPQVKIVALCDAAGNVISFTEMFDRADVRRVHQHINYPTGFNVAGIVSGVSDLDNVNLVLVTESSAVSCALLKGGLKSPVAPKKPKVVEEAPKVVEETPQVVEKLPKASEDNKLSELPESTIPFLRWMKRNQLKARLAKR
ncbi:hypothetical protein N5C81_29450 [Rhizobium pusense]|uniref:GT99 family glycosyltransferase N-terminal domain-containing protein n=1 Tax=Agrobacterium pusense TaxID=648995 RepID=UPI00244CABFF|nr:hypothetical protein [Agrobacterium pusense]MDH1271710.1 hypothetical protein [Agrobacterium pusense]